MQYTRTSLNIGVLQSLEAVSILQYSIEDVKYMDLDIKALKFRGHFQSSLGVLPFTVSALAFRKKNKLPQYRSAPILHRPNKILQITFALVYLSNVLFNSPIDLLCNCFL